VSVEKVKEASTAIKPHDTAERDADGRQPFGDKRRQVTEEELEKILENLRAHPGVVSNNLIVELNTDMPMRILVIKGQDGQVIRRVPETEFYQLLENIDQTNGRLLNKSA